MHIIQPKSIGLVTTHRNGFTNIWFIVVGILWGYCVAIRILGGCSRPTCVFPFRLCRQAITSIRFRIQLLDKFLAINPRDLVHRQLSTFKIAYVITHDSLPLLLRYRILPHVKWVGECYFMPWHIIFITAVSEWTHLKIALWNKHQFQLDTFAQVYF